MTWRAISVSPYVKVRIMQSGNIAATSPKTVVRVEFGRGC